MYKLKHTKATLKDICYGSFVEFEMNSLGQIEVRGKVYADATRHSLKFHFMTDQTSLQGFVKNLKRIE